MSYSYAEEAAALAGFDPTGRYDGTYNDDTWTDADEARAAGHPAYQPDGYQDPALTAAILADTADTA